MSNDTQESDTDKWSEGICIECFKVAPNATVQKARVKETQDGFLCPIHYRIKMQDLPRVTCPAGICQKQVVSFDHDRMFGHLLVDHHWTFDTAQNWVVENMASVEESRELEERYVGTGSDSI